MWLSEGISQSFQGQASEKAKGHFPLLDMGLLPSPLTPELPECGLLFTLILFVPPIPISSLGHLTSD